MKVRVIATIAGNPGYAPGNVVDLSQDVAEEWIREQLAAPLRERPPETVEAASAPETAVSRRGRKRSKA